MAHGAALNGATAPYGRAAVWTGHTERSAMSAVCRALLAVRPPAHQAVLLSGRQSASPSGSPAVWQAGRQPGSPAGCAWQLSAADQQYATFHVTGVWELVKESQTGNAVSAGKIFEI